MELAASIAAEGHQHQRGGGHPGAPRVVLGEAVQGGEEGVHERGVGLDRLLAGGPTEMGRPEEVDVGAEVLAQQVHPHAPSPLGPLDRAPGEALVGLGLHPPELAEQVR